MPKVLLLSLLLFVSTCLCKMHCGTDELQNTVAHNHMTIYCPQHYDHANNCCFQHDDCYGKQKGRKKCDDAFCGCLRKKMSESLCAIVANQFCDLVQVFGQPAYDRSRA
ncbi:hypothetical protein QR680_005679 [Steinernema hermaphroditum]|uniref:Phospholipase A2 domain-containing protein n=1 Tax=Steinernema hermaphroditum TaxID=289476 RepID=A0AA39HSZ4_9BILA|nr:hypothetical protein QR680_005679 [Steinernema hermaphroditum]